MPVYEYRCQQCGRTTDFFVARMGGTPDELACAYCQSREMERVTSTIAVHSPAGRDQALTCTTGRCPFAQQ